MPISKVLLFLFCLVLLGCEKPVKDSNNKLIKDQKKTQISNPDFSKYLDLIKNLTLPIEKHCSDDYSSKYINSNDSTILKYKPKGSQIFGKFNVSDQAVGIIYINPADYIYPVLTTYSMNGELLEKMNPLNSYCGIDEGFYSSSYFKIDRQLNIAVIDSIVTYNLDSEFEIASVKEQQVKSSLFKIQKDGTILESK